MDAVNLEISVPGYFIMMKISGNDNKNIQDTKVPSPGYLTFIFQ